MLRHTMWMCVALIVGCASDASRDPLPGTAPAAGESAIASDNMSGGAAVSTPTMSAAESSTNTMTPSASSKARIAAGVEEETLDSCLAHIPQDASAGQKMLAEQTCRRDFAIRR